MRYLGGKSKIRKQVGALIAQFLTPTCTYLEPFVGGAWVLQEVRHPYRVACDANTHLITMYQHLQKGWKPPTSVSEEQFANYQNTQPPGDPMTAFVGFGCAIGRQDVLRRNVRPITRQAASSYLGRVVSTREIPGPPPAGVRHLLRPALCRDDPLQRRGALRQRGVLGHHAQVEPEERGPCFGVRRAG